MPSTRVEDFRLEDWLPYWLSADDLIAGLAALAVLVACLAIWQALRGREAFERRFARIAQHRRNLRRNAIETRPSRPRMTAATVMQAVVVRLDLLRRNMHRTRACCWRGPGSDRVRRWSATCSRACRCRSSSASPF
jgi:hypothetical protein